MQEADWRYERKFRVQGLQRPALEAWLHQHPAGFRRAFPNRQINNIYYDTADLRCYSENMAGINVRNKYRIRWYGQGLQQALAPRLEVKMKHNELGRKHIEKLADFELKNLPVLRDVSPFVFNTGENYFPALSNRYYRSYFISADGHFRMTIDDQMSFQSPDQTRVNSLAWHDIGDVVLELKYTQEDDDEVQFITKHIPFRQTKNSKYANGLTLVHG